MNTFDILHGDAETMLGTLPERSVHCIVTSPPYYGLRDYGIDGQIGLEESPEAYVQRLVSLFRAAWRVLRDDGTLWLNLGDSYAGGGTIGRNDTDPASLARRAEKYGTGQQRGSWVGSHGTRKPVDSLKPKDLIGIPWRVAFALQADGWYLRSDIIWHKLAPMPESVTDRPTKAHEYVFLLTKNARYFYDAQAVSEPTDQPERIGKIENSFSTSNGDVTMRHDIGRSVMRTATRNRRSVWTLGPQPFSDWGETSRLDRVDSGVLSDGMTHRVFANCPLHGSMCPQDSTEQYDARGVDAPNRTSRTCDCHGQEQACDCASTDRNHGQAKRERSLDLNHQQHGLFATDHSTQTNRIDHADPTLQRDTASVQTQNRTHRTSRSCAQCGQSCCNGESNTCGCESDDSPNNQTPVHSVDIPVSQALYEASIDSLKMNGCTCSFYRTITEKTSHFATMPPKIAELCILAGTSAKGCCPNCGAPWERVVERGPQKEGAERGKHPSAWRANVQGPQRSANGGLGVRDVDTIGWQPTCTCAVADPVPCTVLDPFCGSGTTLSVAINNGRNGIGIELNAEYIELARKRITGTQPALFGA